ESDAEDPSEYKEGGYHPVNIGDKFNDDKYTVVQKLGYGRFSTVWLCDEKDKEQSVAIKIIRSAEDEVAYDEIGLLEHIRDAEKSDPHREKIVSLLDTFLHTGENGRHVCIVFEAIELDLIKLIRQSNCGIEIDKVKNIIGQV
ncbi:hypothetical protein PENTCL1PPCAC_25523, partial [Pristionchus entomophagus]